LFLHFEKKKNTNARKQGWMCHGRGRLIQSLDRSMELHRFPWFVVVTCVPSQVSILLLVPNRYILGTFLGHILLVVHDIIRIKFGIDIT
jgi:hypothetical protein